MIHCLNFQVIATPLVQPLQFAENSEKEKEIYLVNDHGLLIKIN